MSDRADSINDESGDKLKQQIGRCNIVFLFQILFKGIY